MWVLPGLAHEILKCSERGHACLRYYRHEQQGELRLAQVWLGRAAPSNKGMQQTRSAPVWNRDPRS
jgi:hypothetical protein